MGDGRRTTLIVACTTTAFGVSGVSLVAPVLPELAEEFAVSADAMAWFQTLVMLPGVVTAVLMTQLISVVGLRVTLSVALALFGGAGVSLIVVDDFAIAILLRLCQGVGSGGLVAAAVVLLRTLPTRIASRAIGANAAVVSFMMLVLPLAGSALGGIWGRAPFVVYGGALLMSVVTFCTVPRTEIVLAARSRLALPPGRVVWLMTLAMLLNVAFFGWLLYFTPVYLAELDVSIAARGVTLAAQSGIATAVTLMSVRLRETAPAHLLVSVSWLGFAAAMGFVAVAQHATLAIIGLAVAGAFYGIVNPILVTGSARSGVATDVGWWQSSARLGQVVGPVLVSGLMMALAPIGVVLVGGALGMGAAMLSGIRRM